MILPPPRPDYVPDYQKVTNQYIPSGSMLFSESMLYGLRTMWWQEMLDEIQFDQASYGNILTESDYKNSEFYREGLNWFEGMSLNQAQIMAESHDRNLHYSQLTQNVSLFSGKGLAMMGGILAGSIPDPLNFAPFIPVAQRVVKAGRFSEKMKRASSVYNTTVRPSSPRSKVISDIVDPMIGAGIANVAIADKRSKFQEEHDAKMVLLDMAIAGGIGLGIAGARTIRGRMARVDPKTHADRIAMGMEQLEAGEALNLSPHPHKGWNYHNAPDTVVKSPNGTVYSNAIVRVLDDNYLNVDSISVLPEDSQNLLVESLEQANAMGYKGIFIKDELINDLIPSDESVNDVILADMDGARIQIERIPESNGAIITDVLTEADGVSWEYVDTNNQWAYDESSNVIAESIQDRIRESIGEFVEVSNVVKRSIDEIGEATKNLTDTLTKTGQRIVDASNCIIKNG